MFFYALEERSDIGAPGSTYGRVKHEATFEERRARQAETAACIRDWLQSPQTEKNKVGGWNLLPRNESNTGFRF